ncbi:LGFP repeat-containing protein [Streptomyces sioyaensis]|uniref:LGFP repeat-containing protein n=1 Tax=Streptomyces sioyaensis TaxID=67364 RepID=UPI0036B5533C
MKLTLDESCRFGMGVDTRLQETRGEAIQFGGVADSHGGQIVDPSFTVITSQQQLCETLEISATASIRYGLNRVNGRMQFAADHAINESSVYLALHVSVENPPQYMTGAMLAKSADGVWKRNPEEFRRDFGDSYIDEIYTGGSLTILYMFHTRDESSKKDVQGELNAQVGNFMAGVDISAAFQSTVERVSHSSTLEIKAHIAGGRGLQDPSTLQESIALYRNFPAAVLQAGVPYRATAKPWHELPLPPGPTWVETVVRQNTIETCGKYVLDAIQARSRLQYVLDHQKEFINVDPPALEKAKDELNSLIVQWAQTAQACDEDLSQCSLAGISYPTIPWPTRLETYDVLGAKIEDIRVHDSRAAGSFQPQNFPGGPLDEVYDVDPQGASVGRWRISYDSQGRPIGGVYWHHHWGTFVVYGAIFCRYARTGHCQGYFGYPTDDETFVNPAEHPDTPNSRHQHFANHTIWWNANTNKIVAYPHDGIEPPLPPGPI